MKRLITALLVSALSHLCSPWATSAAADASASPGQAPDQKILLFEITTDITPDAAYPVHLLVDADLGEITGVSFMNLSQQEQLVSLADMRNGVVVFKKSGYDVFTLKTSDSFSATDGGRIDATILKSAFDGTYHHLTFALDHPGSAYTISMVDDDGEYPFTSLYLTKNTTFGQIVGIAEVIAQSGSGSQAGYISSL